MNLLKEQIGTDIYNVDESLLLTNFVRSNAIENLFNEVMEVYSSSGYDFGKVMSKYNELYLPLQGCIGVGMHYAIACWIHRIGTDCIDANKEDKEYKTYIVKNCDTGYFKIGKTKNSVEERIAQFRGMVGAKLSIEHTIRGDVEKLLHNKFSSTRTVGEWFVLSEDDICEIKTITYN